MKPNLKQLCESLAWAVAEDEKPESGGCDLSAGMFGPHVSEWLRRIAEPGPLAGWSVELNDDRPIPSATIRAPNGYAMTGNPAALNPGNVIYMLARALVQGGTEECRASGGRPPCPIPPMTNELGKSWRQPPLAELKIVIAEAYTPRGFISQRFSVTLVKGPDSLGVPHPNGDIYGYGSTDARRLALKLQRMTGAPIVEVAEDSGVASG